MTKNSRILFVCLGNICRSPTGEGVMRALLEAQGLNEAIEVDSAGTIGYHAGNRADARMRRAAKLRGYDLSSRARQVTESDFEDFDLIVAMDRENFGDLKAMRRADHADVRLLSDFLDGEWPPDVPDPYYGGDDGFEFVLDMIEQACPKIIDQLAHTSR